MGLDLRKLEHLVAVAEEGGFTRAADRLHMSQQALSTSIRSLEREVGVPLLDRGGNTVRVLPAGEALIADARALHGAVRAALQRARRIGRQEPETLRIGHTPTVPTEEVTELLSHTGEGATANISPRLPAELTEELLAGNLDVGLCRAPEPARGLVGVVVRHDPMHVAVAADHPLAGHARVDLAELAGQTLIVWGPPGRSSYTDLLLHHCRAAGFDPDVRRNAVHGAPPVTAVVGTGDVTFTAEPPGPAAGGQAWVLDVRPPVRAPLHALWPQHTHSAAREAFLTAIGA